MRKNRRIFYFFVIASFLIIFVNSSYAYAAINKIGTINVVMDDNYPPFSFRDAKGDLQGITIDQWKEFERVTGIKVNITGMEWNKAFFSMKSGEFDVIDTISYNKDRTKIFDYSNPYATIDVPIFFQKNLSGIYNVDSLKGFVVGTKKSDNSINVLRQNGVNNIVEYNSAEAVVKAAKEHKIQIFVLGKYPALYYMYKFGIQDEFNYASSLYTSKFYRAVKKGRIELLSTINQGFSKITKAEYKQIENKWFGNVNSSFNSTKLLREITFIIIIVLIIVFFLFTWNRTLRNKVNEKTDELSKTIEELNQESKKLKLSEERFRTIFEQAPLGIALSDTNTGDIRIVNQRYADIVGRTTEEVISKNWRNITHPDDVQENDEKLAQMREGKITEFSLNKRYIKPEGTIVWVNIKNVFFNVDDKENRQYICMVEDITERKHSEEALIASENTFRTLFESSADPVLIMEEERFIDCNPSAVEALGYDSKESIIGKSPWWISPIKQPDGRFSEEKALNIISETRVSKKLQFEWWHKRKDDTLLPVEVMLTRIKLHGRKVDHVLWRDISIRKDMEQKLQYLSYHDQLTGLYNRRFFEEELKRLDVKRNYPLGLLMGDVNGLKLINDSFGHAVGDELLKKVAKIIEKSCRSDDIIARLGGDEFVVILPKTESEEIERIVKRIKDMALNETVGTIEISISLGYETKKDDNEDVQELFNRAEDRMYKKKLFESPSMRGKTIKTIIKTLHEKNKREEQHSRRVSFLCRSMGTALGLPESDVEELRTVGLLHDIGKIAIEENILNKPGKLTEDEWEEMKRHPEIGYRILSTVNDMSEMAEYVLYHHEKWNGMGYPKGLAEKEIPLQSRIIAIVDAYDAMTSERSYRGALSEKYAIEELQKNKGIQFDPELVAVFIKEVVNNTKV